MSWHMGPPRAARPPPPGRRGRRRRLQPSAPAAAHAVRAARRPAVEYSPFYGIEKGAVLQEARVFNDSHVDPRRCQQARQPARQRGGECGRVRASW